METAGRELKAAQDNKVLAVGCGVVSAAGRGVAPLEQALLGNRSALRRTTLSANGSSWTVTAGAVPEGVWSELAHDYPDAEDDPVYMLAADAVAQARRDAGERLARVKPERTGLVLSTTKGNILALERAMHHQPCGAAARRHLLPGLLAEDLARAQGWKGPVRCVSVACISGLVALQQGAKWLQDGAADAVCVVGVDSLSSFIVSGFASLKSCDPAGCRPFDRNRQGLSVGEAGAAMVLVRAEAGERGQGWLLGWGGSNDANHLTGPSRDGSGLALAIRRALAGAGVDATAVDYLHAHGTGTAYNDAMEALAIRSVFNGAAPRTSGSKGMLGHTLGAAGVLESIICILAARLRVLPGTTRLQTRDEGMPERLLQAPVPAEHLTCALKINAGFGGMNGAMVFGF